MNKSCFKLFMVLVGSILLQNANAVSINLGFDGIGNPTLDLLSFSSGGTLDSASITGWALSYDDATDTGALTIAATSVKIGELIVNSTSLTANANGSLHVVGEVSFVGNELPTFAFVGDMAVDVVTREVDQTTVFTLNLLQAPEAKAPGFSLTDFIDEMPSPIVVDIFNFQLSNSLVAVVDSPFPVFNPVPVPAAVWLLGSGLLGLFAVARNKQMKQS